MSDIQFMPAHCHFFVEICRVMEKIFYTEKIHSSYSILGHGVYLSGVPFNAIQFTTFVVFLVFEMVDCLPKKWLHIVTVICCLCMIADTRARF